jgi:hypothetical protein
MPFAFDDIFAMDVQELAPLFDPKIMTLPVAQPAREKKQVVPYHDHP